MNLDELSRKELQALAKQHGVKANLSNAAIIEQLKPIVGGGNDAAEAEEPPKLEESTFNVIPTVEVVPEIAPEVAENKVVEGRKSILVFEETPGPFTIAHQEEEKISYTTVENAKIGDVIEVLEGGVWEEATIKRVNKVSFRVTIHTSNVEATVKMTDSRAITHNKANEQVAIKETESVSGVKDGSVSEQACVEEEVAISHVEQEEMEVAEEQLEEEETFVDEAEEQEEEEVDENDNDVSENEEDAITIPDDELIAGLMDEEEEDAEDAEEVDSNKIQQFEEDEINEMAASEDSFAPACARKSMGQKRFSNNVPLGTTPNKKARTSDLPSWNSSTKSDSYRFEVGTAPTSAKKTPGSVKKTFALTPKANKLSIVPKMNATQKLRLEALQKKNATTTANPLPKKTTPLVGNKVTPITAKVSTIASQPLSEKQVKIQFNFTERVKTAPTPSSVSSTSAKPVVTAVPKKSSTTPNFSRMHQKQFNNSKPITSFVERVSRMQIKCSLLYTFVVLILNIVV
jgi:hypothetical protein